MPVDGQKLYVKRIAYGGEIQSKDRVDLRTAREGGLEITMSANVAEVEGKVSFSSDQVDDLTVILVNGHRIADRATTDQKGRFKMPAVPPGNYQLFAIQDFDPDDWGSPELSMVLESKGVEVELKENDKKQVTLTAISR